MKKFRLLIALVVALVVSAPCRAKGDGQEGVYMFGVGAAFGDSIVYFTDIQFVEGKDMVKNGFLTNRNMYSYQLENYLEEAKNLPHRTCTVFFSKKKSKIEKKYLKLRKKYEGDPAVAFRQLDAPVFKFERFVLDD